MGRQKNKFFQAINRCNGTGSDLESVPDIRERLPLFFHSDNSLLVAKILLWLRKPDSAGKSWWICHRGIDPEVGLGDDVGYVKEHLHLVPMDVAMALEKFERRQLVEWLKLNTAEKPLIPVGLTDAVKSGNIRQGYIFENTIR